MNDQLSSNPPAEQLRNLALLVPGLTGMVADLNNAADEIERLQRLLDMRPPYYCKSCDCGSCGNTRKLPDEPPSAWQPIEIGELIELADGAGTLFINWNERRYNLQVGSKVYANRTALTKSVSAIDHAQRAGHTKECSRCDGTGIHVFPFSTSECKCSQCNGTGLVKVADETSAPRCDCNDYPGADEFCTAHTHTPT
jgi:hypothetical protein